MRSNADEPAAVPAAAAKPTPMSVDDIAARFSALGPWNRQFTCNRPA